MTDERGWRGREKKMEEGRRWRKEGRRTWERR
jgi:hypothetical protein